MPAKHSASSQEDLASHSANNTLYDGKEILSQKDLPSDLIHQHKDVKKLCNATIWPIAYDRSMPKTFTTTKVCMRTKAKPEIICRTSIYDRSYATRL